MLSLYAEKRWIRPGVDLRPTTVGADPGGRGLFAGPHPLGANCFVGAYAGRRGGWRRIGDDPTPYRGSDDYVMETAGWRWTAKKPGEARPDVGQYPVAAAQEPPPGRRANCAFVPFHSPRDLGLQFDGEGKEVVFVALYTTEAVGPHEELFVHYGGDKHRDYEVGLAARPPAKTRLSLEELPRCFVPDAYAAREEFWRMKM